MLALIATNLARRRARSALTALGIAIGVAAIVALLSLTGGLERSASGLVNLGNAEMALFQSGVSDLTASSLPESLSERVRREQGVADAAPVSVLSDEVRGESLLVFGVPSDSFVMRRLVVVAGRRPRAGEVMLGSGAARQLELAPRDTLELEGERFRVSGVYHAGVPFEDQGAALPLEAAQSLTARPTDVTTIAVAIEPGAETAEVADALEDAVPGTVAISEPGQVARADTNVLLIRKAAVVIAVLALVIGALAVMNTMLLAVVERRQEFALLAAIGWHPGRVARLVLGEGVALSLIGSLVGIFAGIAGGALAVDALAASELVSPHVTASGLARAGIVGLAIGVGGGLYPAWRAARLPVAETLSR